MMLKRLFGNRTTKVRRLNFTKAHDPEFEDVNYHLQCFLDLQHLLLAIGPREHDVIEFYSEQEKLRYLHFIMGAADKLSRVIEDELRATMWSGSVGLAQAKVTVGNGKAIEHLQGYGNPANTELFEAGKTGWEAMNEYIAFKNKQRDDNAFQVSGLLLYKTVRRSGH